jgi:hypothetical protein
MASRAALSDELALPSSLNLHLVVPSIRSITVVT